MKEKIIGIYRIRNKINGNVYIGQSVDMAFRWTEHRCDLNGNKHYNTYLQNAWNKYGKDNFAFELVEHCSKENLSIREEMNANAIPSDKLYNINKNFVSNYGENNPNWGKKNSFEVKKKMGLNKTNNKLSEEKVLKIVELLKADQLSQDQIADEFAVSRTVITRISNGTRWAYITGGPVFPVVYDENGKRIFKESHKARQLKASTETKQKMRASHAKRKVVII